MYRVIKNLSFCYGHRLWNYQGKCARCHGHNAVVQAEFSSEKLDSTGMVVDFDEIKAKIQKFLDESLDHKMILHRQDPLAKVLQDFGETVFLTEENPTAEHLAKLIFDHAKKTGLPATSVKVWETPSSCAEYQEE
ncbi:MAG: 6-carboxytetrahydropterin synthase [bacterium]